MDILKQFDVKINGVLETPDRIIISAAKNRAAFGYLNLPSNSSGIPASFFP